MSTTVTFGPWADAFAHPGDLVQDVASKVRKDTDPFVPYRENPLSTQVTFLTQALTVSIVYQMEYAHYMFVGKVMVGTKPKHYVDSDKALHYFTGKHSQAGKDWIGRSTAANMAGWEDFVLERLLHG